MHAFASQFESSLFCIRTSCSWFPSSLTILPISNNYQPLSQCERQCGPLPLTRSISEIVWSVTSNIRNIRQIGIWRTDIWEQTSVRDLAYSEIILYHLIKSPHLTKKDISIFNVKASCEMNTLFLIPISNSSWATWAYIWEIYLKKDPCWGLLLYKIRTENM